MSKSGPPGWSPSKFETRTDGWCGDVGHMPRAVADLIASNMPQRSDSNTVAAIRRRMLARQRAHDRQQQAIADE